MSKLCPRWNYLSNHLLDVDGRIILIWQHPMQVQIVNQSRQSITCLLSLPNQEAFYFTSVYASNETADRVDLWAELLLLHATLDLDNNKWMIGGDFNQIIYPYEHSSDSVSVPDISMYHMRDCLLQAGLFDLRFNGPIHTWTNNQPESPIAKKLDRLLVNSAFLSTFSHAYASFLPQLFSDHTPCLIDLAFSLPKAGTHPFKFQNYLTKHPNFSELILDAWVRTGSMSCNLKHFCWKLKIIKNDLKRLNKDNYSKIQERVTETYGLLQCVQVQVLQSPSPQLFQDEKELHLKWLFLREIEESYFRQKSRINWLKEGDFNTTYFHRICQVRASYNAIRSFLQHHRLLLGLLT